MRPEGNKLGHKAAWDEFDMHESSQDISKFSSEEVIKGLQYKVSFLFKKLRRTPLKEICQDTKRLDHKVLALSNKVGSDLPDMESIMVIEHVAHKGSKIDTLNNVL